MLSGFLLMIFCARSCRRVFGQAGTLHFFHFFQKRYVNTLCIIDPACGIRAGNRPGSQLLCFLDRIDRYIAGAGYGDRLACDILAVTFQHLFCQVEQAVSGRLGPCKRAAVCKSFACQHAFILVANPLILSVHIADLTAAYTDIACRYVGICSDVSVKLSHKALTKCHNLSVGLTFRIKIGAAFTAADRQACQGILENLLESQEFDNTKVNRRMESQAALVGTDRTVKLHTETVVHLHLSLVVYPGNAELYDPLRNRQTLQQRFFSVCFLICLDHNAQRF